MANLARRLIDYIESLEITQGRRAGERVALMPWQRRFIRGAFSPRAATAALTVGRGGGKSTLVAGIAAAAVAGPLRQRRGDVLIAAASFPQARVIFEAARGFLDPVIDAGPRAWQVSDSGQAARILHKASGARIRCLSHDARTAHGGQPALVILDEPAQYHAMSGEKMIAAAETSLGKLPDARLLILGTRAASSDHWFARMLDGGADYSQVHAAKPTDPPFRQATWRKANPSLPYMPDLLAAYKRESRKTKRDSDPSDLASFRALRLNLGVEELARRSLMSAEEWEALEGDVPPRGDVIFGFDLGDVGALSAIAGYWPDSGRLEVLASFPKLPELAVRGRRDQVGDLYQRCLAGGDLLLTGNRTVNIPALLESAISRWGYPAAIVADGFYEANLRDALDEVGLYNIDPVIRRGLEAAVVDLRDFRGAALDGRVTPRPQRLLRAALREATVHVVADGRERLAKNAESGRRKRGRDDTAAAVSGGIRRRRATGASVRIRRTGRRWARLRARVLEAAASTCPCGKLATDEHYKVPINRGGDAWSISNLVALCEGCHYDRPLARVYVRRVRQKIERDSEHPRPLVTKPGVGYVLRRHD